jgi:hypothetical protein
MKKIAPVVCFYMLTINLSFGQHNQINTTKRKVIADEPVKVKSASQTANQSAYFSYDHKISEIMIGNTIPVNFPTKENYPTKQAYLTVINKWIKENPSFIKPEFKSTEITDK